MKTINDTERFVKSIPVKTYTEKNETVRKRIFEAFEKSKQTKSAFVQPNIWRIIMKSRISKLTAAAVVIFAALIGIKMLGDLAEEPSGQIIKQEDPSETVEGQRVVETLHAELNEVRQMAGVGDVKGLERMLSTGRFESKLVAANFLAKIGRMHALETLSMHASGELILDSRSGNIRLHSTNSPDWLEMTADTLWVHTGQSVHEAKQVRLTYDGGDDEDWEDRQREFANMHQERSVLERDLAEGGQIPPQEIDQLRKRLARYNEMLDFIDGAIYVSIENGRLKLDCPTYHSIAFAELRDEIVRVERHGNVVEADSVTLLHRLAPVRTDGPPPPTPDWRSRFDQVYSLDEGEVLRWVRSPFIPERQIYATQELKYYHSPNNNPPPPGYLFFQLNGKLYNWMVAMDECNLALVLMSMGLNRYEYRDGPQKLRRLKLGGDWIERNNVPIEDKLLALERILQNELGRTIRFEKRKDDQRDVIIVRGQYKRVPLEGVEHPDNIYVYTDLWEDFSGPEPVDGGGRGSLVELIEMVGSHFNRPIVFETENLSDITVSYFTSQSYDLATANAKTREDMQEILDSVLQNLSKQTSLQFEYGQRDQNVWFITEQNKTKR